MKARTENASVANEPKKKRQHYVPRLILRGFSADGYTISLLAFRSEKRVDGASLKEQCYEDYFYGRDGGIEEGFAKLEGEFAALLGDLSQEHLDTVPLEETDKIRQFVHYQRLRTAGAAADVNDFGEALAKSVLSKDARVADVLDKVRIKAKKPQFESLHHAVTGFPLVLDLGVRFLLADKKKTFIVSDNPVVASNQYVEHHPVLREHPSGSTGLAVKGLQLFLPVSPRVCIALFDKGTYRYGSDTRLTCRASSSDIQLLNVLQAANAQECIYFNPSQLDEAELVRLRRERAKYEGWKVPKFSEGPLTRRPDGLLSQIIMSSAPELRLGAKFNFLKVTDDTTYEGYDRGILPPRSEKLLDLHEEYCKFIDTKTEQARAERTRNETAG